MCNERLDGERVIGRIRKLYARCVFDVNALNDTMKISSECVVYVM